LPYGRKPRYALEGGGEHTAKAIAEKGSREPGGTLFDANQHSTMARRVMRRASSGGTMLSAMESALLCAKGRVRDGEMLWRKHARSNFAVMKQQYAGT
jgi:hypothetical protein